MAALCVAVILGINMPLAAFVISRMAEVSASDPVVLIANDWALLVYTDVSKKINRITFVKIFITGCFEL